MKSAFAKETVRSITHSLGRFLAIAAIVALGTGFYAGLRMTAPDMKLAADEFFDGTALMDVRVLSTLGLTDADSPATISQNDPAFAEFWSELLRYKKVADLDVQNAEIVTDITAVEAATAREDSTQTNYRYAIKSATMTVNGKTITYDASKGFSA